MRSIELNDKTAEGLAAIAKARGLTLEEYLSSLVVDDSVRSDGSGITAAEFDAELDKVLFDGPSLPPDFSRSDIYIDHD